MEDLTLREERGFLNRISKISWGAVIAGAVTVISIMFLLNILGLGIGLTTIDPLQERDPFEGLGVGTAIWWIVSNLAALFCGGLVASRMSGYTSNIDGALHGFLAWAVYLILGVLFFVSTIGSIFSGVGNLVGSLFGDNGSKDLQVTVDKAQSAAKENTMASYKEIKEQAFSLIQSAEKYNVLPGDATEETKQFMSSAKKELRQMNLKNDLDDFFRDVSVDLDKNGDLDINVEGNKDLLDKEKIKNYLAENTDLSKEEINGVIAKWDRKINQTIDKVEKTYKEAKQEAIEFGDKAADAAGTSAILAFLMLLLGCGAAFFGGVIGSPEYKTLAEEEREIRRERRR